MSYLHKHSGSSGWYVFKRIQLELLKVNHIAYLGHEHSWLAIKHLAVPLLLLPPPLLLFLHLGRFCSRGL